MSGAGQLKAGVLGWPIEHSLSPKIHQYWLRSLNRSGSYSKIATPAERLEETLNGLQHQGFRGVNLTVPHKVSALSYMDEIDDVARQVGAINTVVVENDGDLVATNTDVYGFSQNLRTNGFDPADKIVTIFGAGGAARAAIVALLSMGAAQIRIVSRKLAHHLAQDFGSKLSVYHWGDTGALKDGSLLINATSLGLPNQPFPTFSLEGLKSGATVMDMVYTPPLTPFLQKAQHEGYETIDGFGMLLYQAKPCFELFYGVDPQVTDDLREFVLSNDGESR